MNVFIEVNMRMIDWFAYGVSAFEDTLRSYVIYDCNWHRDGLIERAVARSKIGQACNFN